MTELYQKLKEYGKVKTNELLSKHTTFKIGGPADFFVSIASTEQLVECLRHLDGAGVSYVLLGGGSNMLVSDEGFAGVVIEVKAREKRVEDNYVIADAGCITVDIAQFSIQNGLTGFEWGVGVPGTIGGAVRGNAGAMGGEMKDNVDKIAFYRDGEVVEITNEECEFGYRSSAIKRDGGVVLEVWLKLEQGKDKSGMKQMLEHLQYRNKTQPQGYSSTGCIFKNADYAKNKAALLVFADAEDEKVQGFKKYGKISAGWLIEQAGMKGVKKGNAEVSEVHGNFILNKGGATAAEVLDLIDEVKQTVYNALGIQLEEEIQILK